MILLTSALLLALGPDVQQPDAPSESFRMDFWFGRAVAACGDLDGDGAGDFLVSAPRAVIETGEGGERSSAFVQARSGADGRTLYTKDGPWGFGDSLAVLGDVDGDGAADFAAGTWTGVVLVCSGADGSTLRSLEAPFEAPAGQVLEPSVVAPGDLDGDGAGDLAVSWTLSGQGERRSTIRVHSGTTGRQLDRLDSQSQLARHLFALPDLNGDGVGELACTHPLGEPQDPAVLKVLSGRGLRELFTLVPPRATVADGLVVVALDDVDGDGIRDLAVGASEPMGTEETDDEGRYVREQPGVVFLCSGRDGSRLGSPWEGDSATFAHALASGADVDGDGLRDLLVTECFDLPREMQRGRCWLVSGRDLAVLHEIQGPRGDYFGASAAFVEDLDGDGIADYVLGNMHDYPGSIERGTVDVRSGRTGDRFRRLDR